MSTKPYNWKFLALDEIIKRGRIPEEVVLLLEWIKHTPTVLSQIKLVEDASFAPNIFTVVEDETADMTTFASDLKMEYLILSKLKAGQMVSQEEYKLISHEILDTLIVGAKEILEAMVNLVKDDSDKKHIYMQIDFNAYNLPHEIITRAYETNEWLETYKKYRSSLREKAVNGVASLSPVNIFVEPKPDIMFDEEFENKLKIIKAQDELDTALGNRDFERCKELKRIIDELRDKDR